MTEYYHIISSSPLFLGVEERHYTGLLHCLGAQSRHYPRGKAIFHAGDRPDRVGVVLRGRAQVCREDAEGNRAVLAAIDPGDLFGEAYACAGTPSLPISVWAEEACDILLLDLGRVVTMCSAACSFHNTLIRNLLQVLAQKNVFLSAKMEHLAKRNLREKILSYLREQEAARGGGSFTIPFDRQALADYLCADRSALSRELSRLQQEGVLETRKNTFRFL